MLLVKTYVAPSEIEGLGLFAGQFIRKGTQIWEFVEPWDRIIPVSEIRKLPPKEREWFARYTSEEWLDATLPLAQRRGSGKLILEFDDARFCNHSFEANTHEKVGRKNLAVTFASRDIQKCEEITTDYSAYDAQWARKLGSAAKMAV